MDTQGTDDSDMKDDDERILKNAFKKLYDNNIQNIKIIWIVSGDMDRKRGEFKKQAKFINCFINDDQRKCDIWQSCLIIHKKGKIQPSLKDVRGAIAAAMEFGSNFVYEDEEDQMEHLFGFKCIDWIKNKKKDPILKLASFISDEKIKNEQLLQLNKYIICMHIFTVLICFSLYMLEMDT